MRLLAFFKTLDRRFIFLFVGLAVIFPFLLDLDLPEYPTVMVKAIYNTVEGLQPGSLVLMPFDYDPSTAPELDPMAAAVVRHCLSRDLRVCFMALWPEGQGMVSNLISGTVQPEFPDKVYGRDYVNLGYKAGGQGLINAVLLNMRSMFTTDAAGVPVDSLPIMIGVTNLKDFKFIMNFSAGRPGSKEWIQFAGDPGRIPVASGSTAVQAPLLYPYYPSQMVGLMGGLKGAAEYEAALLAGYPRFKDSRRVATELMVPQAMAHFVIMLFIVLGNIIYFAERRAGKR
ncbi:hypothetical protein JXA88_13195 [Candidatus Fermentibacteria bacterium]|nr:hypothetical protein [Candidatus Fermentibacteria bacterium]